MLSSDILNNYFGLIHLKNISNIKNKCYRNDEIFISCHRKASAFKFFFISYGSLGYPTKKYIKRRSATFISEESRGLGRSSIIIKSYILVAI